MVKLAEIRKLHGFEPIYSYSQLQYEILESHVSKKIQDSRLYKAIKKLTEKAYPTEESEYEKRWINFYLPLKRRGYLILVPLGIVLYDQEYFLSLHKSQIDVCKGREKNDFYLALIEQISEFTKIIKKDPDIIQKSIPNDIRTGRILGKYVMEDLLSPEKKEEMPKRYREHLKMVKGLTFISLNDYLNTVAICYRAAFGSIAEGLTAEQMYWKWADGRDCGMLEIKDRESREDFGHWLTTRAHCGGHPFEIKFSWHGHGIHLIPPDQNRAYYTLRVTDYSYAKSFIEMVKALIKNGIPFEAHDLESVLDYLVGDSYFSVNAYDKHFLFYSSEDRKLIKHIEWDDPKVVRWKKREGDRIRRRSGSIRSSP